MNEFAAIFIPFLILVLVLLASTRGYTSLVILICVIQQMAYSMNGVIFPAWGMTVNLAVLVYMPTYLATDLIAERYGLAAAKKAIYLLCGIFVILPVFCYLPSLITPVEFSQDSYDAFQLVFGNSLRISIAAICTVYFAQYFDVWLYDYIHRKTGDSYLWLRNCGSTFLSSLLDTAIFWTIAFYGVFPNVLEMALTAWLIKLVISSMDTPFIYLAKRFTPKDLKDV